MANFQKEIKDLIGNNQILNALNLFYDAVEKTELINEVIILLKSNLIYLNKKSRVRKVLAIIVDTENENFYLP